MIRLSLEGLVDYLLECVHLGGLRDRQVNVASAITRARNATQRFPPRTSVGQSLTGS